jgi:hypothetical protein
MCRNRTECYFGVVDSPDSDTRPDVAEPSRITSIRPGQTVTKLLRMPHTRSLAAGVVAELKQLDTIIVDE